MTTTRHTINGFTFSDFTAPDGHRYLNFEKIDSSKSNGALNFTHEYNASFCVDTGRWSIDTVDAGGWHDLEQDEAIELVSCLDLKRVVAIHLGYNTERGVYIHPDDMFDAILDTPVVNADLPLYKACTRGDFNQEEHRIYALCVELCKELNKHYI